jgi:hypothetical protein
MKRFPRSRAIRNSLLRSSSLRGKLRAGVASVVTFPATPDNTVLTVVLMCSVLFVAELSVLEPIPSRESVAALSVSDFFTSSSCPVVDGAAQIGLILAAQLDSSGAPQHLAARIFEVHRSLNVAMTAEHDGHWNGT